MLEVFGIFCLVVIVIFFAKELGSRFPIGCLLIGGLLLFCCVKACVDMNEEEEKAKQFQEERKKKWEEDRRRFNETGMLDKTKEI